MNRHRLPTATTARPGARRQGLLTAVTITLLATAGGLYLRGGWDILPSGRSPTGPGAEHQWPDLVDSAATTGFLFGVLGLASLGYIAMVADVRAYLRSLRGALVVG